MEHAILGVIMVVGFLGVGWLAWKKSDLSGIRDIFDAFREKVDDDMGDRSGELKKDIKDTLATFNSMFGDSLSRFSAGQGNQIKQLQDGLKNQFDTFSSGQERQSKQLTEEVSKQITILNQNIDKLKSEHSTSMKDLQTLVNSELDKVRKDNDEKLEKIRKSVDDQLESKLQKSVQQSFNSVLTQLQQVDKSLGEMQSIAKNVDGLKKILGNVKTRGNFGEVQLETILDEIIPGRYEKQVMIQKGNQDRVDFAISLPGDSPDSPVLLPIDSKFPFEAFEKLQTARDKADKKIIEEAIQELRKTVKAEAKSIHDKYIQVPKTTTFAIMFLAVESVYAEVISQTDLINEIRKTYQVTITGPSTMVALLNSLQMGFQTLKLKESAGKINVVLRNTKVQFSRFAEVLENMRKHLNTTSKDLDNLINTRTNQIMRALDKFEDINELNDKVELNITKDVDSGTDSNIEED